MELKYGTHKIPGGINCSNRTFMELKFAAYRSRAVCLQF